MMLRWGLVVLLAALLLPQTVHGFCEDLGEFSICQGVLNYTQVFVTDSCQLEQEYQMNITAWQMGLVSPPCRVPLAQLMCVTEYPNCAEEPPCRSMCEELSSACTLSDISTMSSIAAFDDLLACNTYPTIDCYAPVPEAAPEEIPTARCEEYRGDICGPWVDYPVYIPHGWTQARLEDEVRNAVGVLGLVGDLCLPAMGAYACHQAFNQCNDTVVDSILGLDLEHKPAYPRLPCYDTCQNYAVQCSRFTELDARLTPNCSKAGSLAGGQRCDEPSFIADWPLSESLLGIVEGKAVITQCNPYQAEASIEVACQPPFVRPEDDSTGIVRRQFPDSSCDLPCPLSFLFPEEAWRSLHKLMYLTVPSVIASSFLFGTWLMFPSRRKQKHVVRFLGLTWAVSVVLVFGFAAIPKNAPRFDLRYIQCENNVGALPMGLNYCTFQAVSLFWLTLALSARWLVIALDAYLTVVRNMRLVGMQKKKKLMAYDVLCWGLPTFNLACFLLAGGKLGGDNEATLDFCFLGNRTLREVGEWADYLFFFVPIMIFTIVGTACVFSVIKQMWMLSRARAATNASVASGGGGGNTNKRKRNYKQYLRLVGFLCSFVFVFSWIFCYRIGFSLVRDDVETKGYEWVECLIKNPGDFLTCGERPDLSIDAGAQFGMHAAIAGQGLLMLLAWGTQKSIYVEWVDWLRGKGFIKGSSFGSRTGGSTQGRRASLGSDVSRGDGSGQGDIELTSRNSSSKVEGVDDELDERPAVKVCSFPWWTERWVLKRRRWEWALALIVFILVIIIIFVASFTDDGVQGEYTNDSSENDGGQAIEGGPRITVTDIEFESMDIGYLTDSMVLMQASLITTAKNPCGKKCPLIIEEMSLDVNIVFEGEVVGTIVTPTIKDLEVLPNADGSTDPILFRMQLNNTMSLAMNDAGTVADGFVRLMRTYLREPVLDLQLNGTAVASSFGLEIDAIKVDLVTSLPAADGLRAEIFQIDLPGDNPGGGLIMTADMDAFNPGVSGVAGGVGDLAFDLVKEGLVLGRIFVPDLTLRPGSNPQSASGYVWPQTEAELQAAEQLISQYMSGRYQEVEALVALDDPRTRLESNVSWLIPSIEGLRLTVPMEGVVVSPLESVQVNDLAMDFSHPTVPEPLVNLTVSADVALPFGFPMNITGVDIDFDLRLIAKATMTGATYGANCACTAAHSCVCDSTPENEVASFVCPEAGTVISSIKYASYGNPTQGSTCDDHATDDMCHSLTSETVMANKCLGLSNCTFTVLRADFGDPCPQVFVNQTQDQSLVASVQCAPAVDQTTDVLSQVAALCNDKEDCMVSLEPSVLGNPVPGCLKELSLEWSCDNVDIGPIDTRDATATSAEDGSAFPEELELQCEGPAFAQASQLGVQTFSQLTGGAGTLTLSLKDVLMAVSDEDLFGAYITNVITTSEVSRAMSGLSSVTVQTSIGEVKVEGLQLRNLLTVTGINGFNNQITVSGLDVLSGAVNPPGYPGQSTLDLRADASMTNDASITADMGAVGFDLYRNNEKFGFVQHPDLDLAQGPNTLQMTGLYVESPTGNTNAKAVLTNYLQAQSTNIELRGAPELVANRYLKAAFATMVLQAQLPGLPLPRMVIRGYYKWNILSPTTLRTKLVIVNTFSVPIEILNVNFKLRDGEVIGNIADNRCGGTCPILLQPNARSVTNTMTVDASINFSSIGFLFNGGGNVDALKNLDTTLRVRIGTYVGDFLYEQNGIRIDSDGGCIDNSNNCNTGNP